MNKLILIFVALLLSCGDSKPKSLTIPQGATVLILGDSLSYGTGANTGEDYPSLLAKSTNWNIINEGVPGETSAGGLARLPDLLAKHQPKLLIVELGGNDLLRQVSPTEIAQNLNDILALANTQSIQTVLVAIPEINPLKATFGNLSDHPLYESIALNTSTPLISHVFSDVLSDKNLRSDQIHANAKGYDEVAKRLTEKLKELGFAK